jgi:hypothetical protein
VNVPGPAENAGAVEEDAWRGCPGKTRGGIEARRKENSRKEIAASLLLDRA